MGLRNKKGLAGQVLAEFFLYGELWQQAKKLAKAMKEHDVERLKSALAKGAQVGVPAAELEVAQPV